MVHHHVTTIPFLKAVQRLHFVRYLYSPAFTSLLFRAVCLCPMCSSPFLALMLGVHSRPGLRRIKQFNDSSTPYATCTRQPSHPCYFVLYAPLCNLNSPFLSHAWRSPYATQSCFTACPFLLLYVDLTILIPFAADNMTPSSQPAILCLGRAHLYFLASTLHIFRSSYLHPQSGIDSRVFRSGEVSRLVSVQL